MNEYRIIKYVDNRVWEGFFQLNIKTILFGKIEFFIKEKKRKKKENKKKKKKKRKGMFFRLKGLKLFNPEARFIYIYYIYIYMNNFSFDNQRVNK